MDVNKLLNNEIVISTYCGPQPAFEQDGISYPDRITEEQYRLLKNSGINVVFGHEDLMSTLYDLGVQNNKILRTDKSGSCIFAVRGDSDLGKVLVSKNVLHKEPIPYAWEFTYLFVLIIAFILCFINRERVKMKDMTDNV